MTIICFASNPIFKFYLQSGSERPNRSTRLNSSNDLVLRGENGEIDYKKLYEEQLTENEKIREKLKKSEEELRETKSTLERLNTVVSTATFSRLSR